MTWQLQGDWNMKCVIQKDSGIKEICESFLGLRVAHYAIGPDNCEASRITHHFIRWHPNSKVRN